MLDNEVRVSLLFVLRIVLGTMPKTKPNEAKDDAKRGRVREQTHPGRRNEHTKDKPIKTNTNRQAAITLCLVPPQNEAHTTNFSLVSRPKSKVFHLSAVFSIKKRHV